MTRTHKLVNLAAIVLPLAGVVLAVALTIYFVLQ